MNKFGLYNLQTAELKMFDSYEDAFTAYLDILREAIKVSYLLPDYYAIAYIEPERNRIVQLDRLTTTSTCKIIELDITKKV